MELRCPACGSRESISIDQMVEHLRGLGMFKRQQEPDVELVRELYMQQISLLRCFECGHVGYGESSTDEEEEWCGGRTCDRCRSPIPAERLEVFPDTRRCTACQQADESGDSAEPEYCERCGAIMKLQLRGGSGLTSYVMRCSDCGYSR